MIATQGPPVLGTFDVRAVNRESDSPKRTKRRWLIGIVIFPLLWALMTLVEGNLLN